jgi:hypothetical protein
MSKLSKSLALILVFFVAISSLCLTVKPACGQAVTKPPIPEFTAKYVDYSYDIPPTYGTNAYNGKTEITSFGEHVDNRTVEITITNLPFSPFNDSNGNTINRFYDVRYKGSYTNDWTTMFSNQTQGYQVGQPPNPYMKYGYAVEDYSAQTTTIIYHLTWNVPINGSIDFQVESLDGYTEITYADSHIIIGWAGFAFHGQESGWSDTKTITLGENASSTSNPSSKPSAAILPSTTSLPTSLPNSPTAAPSSNSNQIHADQTTVAFIPLETFFLVAAALVAVIAGLVILLYIKTRKNSK